MTLKEDTPQWRIILSHEWDNATQERREEICNGLNLSAGTVRRWIRGEGNPKSRQTLVKLEELIPEMSQALRKEFSSFFIDSHDTLIRSVAPVYDRVLQVFNDTEQSRVLSTITEIVLDAMVKHVDIEQLGLVAILGQLKHDPKQNVEYLQFYAWSGHGTGAWFEDQAIKDYQVDALSVSGQSVKRGLPIYYSRDRELGRGASLACVEQINSAAAFPILRHGRIAGSVFVAAAVPNFFTRLKRDTISLYMQMMSLAFNDTDFIAREQIRLSNDTQESIRLAYNHLLDQFEREHPDMSRKHLQRLAREYEA
jgi:hypothetical protein